MAEFGALSILPPLVAIGGALATRKVYPSLLAGIAVGALIFHRGNLGQAFLQVFDWLLQNVSDPFQTGVILFTILLGGLVAIMQQAGGVAGFGATAARWAKTPRRAQMAALASGIVLFVDDYFNVITRGTVLRPVTDRMRVSREKLAYILDSVAAPIVILAPVSTWVGVVVGILANPALELDQPYTTFLSAVPFNYYAWMAIAWVLVIALTHIEYGPMRRAEARSAATGKVYRDEAVLMQSTELMEEHGKNVRPNAANLLLPLFILVVSAFFFMWWTGRTALAGTGDPIGVAEAFRNADSSRALLFASALALTYALITFLIQKTLGVEDFFDGVLRGAKAMLPAILILILAWTIGTAVAAVELNIWLAESVAPLLDGQWVPLIAFLTAAVMAFSTGTSFGTFAIMLPITVPIAVALGGEFLVPTVAATLGGAVFGDHASPISDTTVISSMAAASDHIDHVRTQLPYALTIAAAAGLGYLVLGATGSGLAGWIAVGGATAIAFLLAHLHSRSHPIRVDAFQPKPPRTKRPPAAAPTTRPRATSRRPDRKKKR